MQIVQIAVGACQLTHLCPGSDCSLRARKVYEHLIDWRLWESLHNAVCFSVRDLVVISLISKQLNFWGFLEEGTGYTENAI